MEDLILIIGGLGLLALLMSTSRAPTQAGEFDLSDIAGEMRRFRKMYDDLMELDSYLLKTYEEQAPIIFKQITEVQTMDQFLKTNPEGKRAMDLLIQKSESFTSGTINLKAEFQQFGAQFSDQEDEKTSEKDRELIKALAEELDEMGEYIEANQQTILVPLKNFEESLVAAQTKSDSQQKKSQQGMASRLMRAEQQSQRVPQVYNVLFETHVDNRQVHFQTIQQNLHVYQELARSLESVGMEIDSDDLQQPVKAITFDSSKRKKKKTKKGTNFAAAPQNAYHLPDPAKRALPPPKPTAKPDFVPRSDAEYGNLTPAQILEIIEKYKKKKVRPKKIANMVKTRISNLLKQIENNDKLTLQFKNRLQKDYTKMSHDFLLLQAACHYANITKLKDIPDQKHILELIQKMEQTYQTKFGESLKNAMNTWDYHKEKTNPAYDTQAGTKRRTMGDDDPNPRKKKKLLAKDDL